MRDRGNLEHGMGWPREHDKDAVDASAWLEFTFLPIVSPLSSSSSPDGAGI